MQLEIVATESPSDTERQALLDLLINYNASRAGEVPFRCYALLLREPNHEEILGGLYGYALYDWFSVELLIVPEAYRGHGFGAQLLQRAEAFAVERNCVGIWLNTFSFQARGFYEKQGYEVFGSLPDHPRGGARYFLRKWLTPVQQNPSGESPARTAAR